MEHINDIDDRLPMALGVLAFGLLIPQATGLFGPIGMLSALGVAGSLWFVGLAAAIWHGNRWLLFRQRERLDWFQDPVGKVVFLVVGCVFYTGPLTASAIGAWLLFTGQPVVSSSLVQVVLLNVICVLVVAHLYETAFLIKARKDDLVQVERAQRTRAEAELSALRSQVDPHFLFNSLNTLSWLIERNPEDAGLFVARLADVYRYLLSTRDRELVQLSDELDFADAYLHLLSVRFGGSVRLFSELGGLPLDRFLLPPVSLQVLIENAVKHNQFSEAEPLELRLSVDAGSLVLCNPLRPKRSVGEGVGLVNLQERYWLACQREVQVVEGDPFCVRLPLIEVGA